MIVLRSGFFLIKEKDVRWGGGGRKHPLKFARELPQPAWGGEPPLFLKHKDAGERVGMMFSSHTKFAPISLAEYFPQDIGPPAPLQVGGR